MLPTNDGKIVNLKTGETRYRNIKDLFVYETTAKLLDFKTTDFSVVKKFILDLCSENVDYFNYKSILYGYFLTGETREKSIYICVGNGNNGKTTFNDEIISEMMGNFHDVGSKDLLLTTNDSKEKKGSATPHLEPLKYATRLVSIAESKDYMRLNSSLKVLTGRDKIVCRGLFQKQKKFKNYAKLLLHTNNIPKWDSSDDALNRRIVLLPYNTEFVKKLTGKKNEKKADDKLIDNILANVDGLKDKLFTYFVMNSMKYYKDGLPKTPKICQMRKEEVIQDTDPISDFIEECCDTTDEKSELSTKELYKIYSLWYTSSKKIISISKFTRHFTKRKFKSRRSNGKRLLIGIKLKKN